MDNTKLQSTVAPAFPFAPVEYSQQQFDQFARILTQYLKQNDNINGALLGLEGCRFLNNAFGAWHDTTTQSAAANTPTLVTMNTMDYSNGVTLVSTSKITVQYTGVYNLQFSMQGVNPAAATDNITVWFRVNGVDLLDSAGLTGIPPKHGAINGALIFGWNQFLPLNAGDYVQIYWTTDNGTSTLTTYPISVTPAHPLSPSVAVSMNYVSRI
jgi:hypothetical protein